MLKIVKWNWIVSRFICNSDTAWNKGIPEAELPPDWWQMEMFVCVCVV